MVDIENIVTNFYVSKMKCDDCIQSAGDSLKMVPGFESAEFDLKEGTAKVRGKIDPQAVCHALGEAGYPATVKSN